MKLRDKLKEKADSELVIVVAVAAKRLIDLHPVVTGEELAVLAFSKRTASLKKAVLGRMVGAMEAEIMERYDDQLEFDTDVPDEDADPKTDGESL